MSPKQNEISVVSSPSASPDARDLPSALGAEPLVGSSDVITVREASKGWLSLDLREVWRFRDLTMIFVWRDFIAYYKQTILGPLWYLIQPLLTTIVFTVIFGRVAKLPTDGLPPFLFYLAGVTGWNYFAECVNRTSGTFIANAGIFGKVYFPRLCVPISTVISGLIKFGIQFLFFVAFLLYFWASGAAIHPNLWMLSLPLLLIIMAALGLGLGIIVSALTIRYRDLQQLIAFGVQLMMYATPVIYPLSVIPERFRWLALLNPMTPIIETFRHAFIGGGGARPEHLLIAMGTTTVVLFAGLMLFHRVERTFMDTV